MISIPKQQAPTSMANRLAVSGLEFWGARLLLAGFRLGHGLCRAAGNHSLLLTVVCGVAFPVLLSKLSLAPWWLPVPGLIAIVILVRKPVLGLAWFILLVPLERYLSVPVLGTFTSHELLICLTLIGWLAKCCIEGRFPEHVRTWFLALPWVIALLVSVVVYPGIGAGIKGALRWGEPVVAFLIGCELYTDEDFRRLILPSAWLSGLVTSLFGIIQPLTSGLHDLQTLVLSREGGTINLVFNRFIRAHATFVQANHFAAYLILMSGPMLYFGWKQRRRPFGLAVYGITVVALAGALVMTFSRGAWLAAAGASIILLLILRKYKLLLAILLSLSILFGTALVRGNEERGIARRVASLTRLAKDETVSERVAMYRVGLALVRWNPFFGIGVGRYRSEVAGLTILGLPDLAVKTHLHSLYLQMATEIGVLGVGTFGLWILGLLVPLGYRLRKEAPTLTRTNLSILFLPIMGYLIQSLFDVFLYRGLHLVFGLWLGLVAGIGTAIRVAPEPEASRHE